MAATYIIIVSIDIVGMALELKCHRYQPDNKSKLSLYKSLPRI